MPDDDHNCPISGVVGANHAAVLRELDLMRMGLENALRQQDDRLMQRIDERFGMKLEACEGIEKRVDGHDTRLDKIEKSDAGRSGETRVRRAMAHAILGGAYALLGFAAAFFGGHMPIKH